MLRLRFLASSSILAAAGGKAVTGHASRVNKERSHRLTISWLPGSLRYMSYHLNVRWEEVFSLFKFEIDYARIVISADGAFSQGACESATRERGPRDGANAKVLGMGKAGGEEKKEKMRNDCGRWRPWKLWK
jgi:hypothetical protein